jgi:glycogen operon protein
VEGPTSDPNVIKLREQKKRNLMASLLLSVGVPMISGGDELGRTQRGNNNAYCHDDEISWTRWSLMPKQRDFLECTRRLVRFRRSQPTLTRRKYFQGRTLVLFTLGGHRRQRRASDHDTETDQRLALQVTH